MASGAGGGTAATERLIRSAQKSTNQLKALLAGGGGGGGRSSGAVEVILADISDSLSQALASLMLRAACDDQSLPAAAAPPPPPEASLLPSYGQCVVANSGGRSVSKRKAQRRRYKLIIYLVVFIKFDCCVCKFCLCLFRFDISDVEGGYWKGLFFSSRFSPEKEMVV